MRISPISYSINNNYINQNQNIREKRIQNSPSFTSVFADANPDNEKIYGIYTLQSYNFSKLKRSSTRIFRELPSQIAVSKILKPNEKNEIKVLGCSDGSEAWAYGIVMKEEMGDKAKENVKIKGVDMAPYMIEIAKTGKIVCSDVERKYANGTGVKTGYESPVKGDKWNYHLKLSTRPEGFDTLLAQYPQLKYYERDPVVRKCIGEGLDWFEVNKEGLPETTFTKGDMLNHLTPDKDSDAVVYVVANTAGYLMERGIDDYIGLFEKIKKENEGSKRKVYVVVGDVENTLLSPNSIKTMGIKQGEQNRIRNSITNLGFDKIPDHKLRKAGVVNYKDAANKIYQLKD